MGMTQKYGKGAYGVRGACGFANARARIEELLRRYQDGTMLRTRASGPKG